MRKINKIILHCTATPEGRYTTVEDIRRWHKQKGFNDIGYHYIVYLDGTIHDGRNVEIVGAHTKGYNTGSIGIAYVGGINSKDFKPKDTRTEEQKKALHKFLVKLMSQYEEATLHGHNEFAAKACPSFNVKKEYNDIIKTYE